MENLAEKISDSELEVMRLLWEAGTPLPISDIRIALHERKGWEPTTVKTLVNRLLSKEVIAQEKRKVFYYRPLLSQEEYKGWATHRLIDKLYRGSARSLVAALVHSDSLSDEDIRELTVPGKVTARTIAPGVFREVWDQAAERPDGFMGMFF